MAAASSCGASTARAGGQWRRATSHEQRGAESREIVLDLGAGVVGADRADGRGEDGAGVERLDDAHDAHAGFAHRRR